MSEEDIGKGQQWSPEIAEQLAKATFGIICLTPENADSVWLHFEAGALSTAVKEKPWVCPYLLGLRKAQVHGPLASFQMAEAEKDDTFRLVQSLNKAMEQPLDDDTLAKCFEKWWPELARDIDGINAEQPSSPGQPKRTPEEMLEEIVTTVRTLPDTVGRTAEILATLQELLSITRKPWRGLFGTLPPLSAPPQPTFSAADLKALLGLQLEQKPVAPKET